MKSSTLAQALLSNKTFDMEFHGYLSNHAKHAIVALDKLGAPDERIQEYWSTYTTATPYNLSLHKLETPWDSVVACKTQNWTDWRGKKIHWQEMTRFLEDQDQSPELLVKQFGPDLLSGIAGALTHGIIHLGWAIDAQNPWMIKEGLSYLNFCYLPIASLESKAVVEPDAISSILRIAKQWHDEDLKNTWIEPTKERYDETFHPELVPAGFQWHLAKVLKDAHSVATKVPSWLRDKPLPEVWEDLYRMVAIIYLGTRSPKKDGSFVVLHLISSLWALEKVCNVIDEEEITRTALENFWGVAVCLLSTGSGGFPTVERLEAANRDFSYESTDDKNLDWEATVTRGCAEEEEHNIKLVYVCRELWQRFGRWKGFSEAADTFTLTPNIGPTQTKFVE